MQEDGHYAVTSAGGEQLSLAVRDAISRSEPIRASSIGSISVRVVGNRAILTGVVATEAQRWIAEHLALSVPGVLAVENNLSTSEHLERKIALALGADETTRHLRVGVRVVGSTATLFGAVNSQAEINAVLAVASRAGDSLELHTSLRVRPGGARVILLEQHSLEGRQMAGAGLNSEASTGVDEPDSAAPIPSSDGPTAAPAEGIA